MGAPSFPNLTFKYPPMFLPTLTPFGLGIGILNYIVYWMIIKNYIYFETFIF